MKEITFTLLRNCNWSCKYCGIHKQAPVKEEQLVRAFKAVLQNYTQEDHVIVNLSGGEPGLLKRSTIYGMLEAMATMLKSSHLNVFTNGKGFWINDLLLANVKKFYPGIFSYRIVWHCTSDIQKMERIRKLPKKLSDRVIPMAVVTKPDMPYLQAFIEKNKDRNIFFVTHNHYHHQDKLGLTHVDLKEVMSLLEQYYGSYSLRSLEIPSFILKSSNPSMKDHRDFCENNLPKGHHVFDISTGEVCRVKCCMSLSEPDGNADCSSCVNYQQFYENALDSAGYTQGLPYY